MALALVGGAAHAQEWSAADEFDYTAPRVNPSGVWTYGFTATSALSTAITLSVPGTRGDYPSATTFLPSWESSGTPGWGWSAAVYNNRATPVNLHIGLVIEPGKLYLHPAENARKSVLRFTAPTRGCYQYTGSFELMDVQGGRVDVTVRQGETVIKSALLVGTGDITSAAVESVFLASGTTIDAFVGDGGNGFGDDSVATDIHVVRVSNGVDTNNDGTPDSCEPDSDDDGIIDLVDNCPSVANPDQANNWGGLAGDACECAITTCGGATDCRAAALCQPAVGCLAQPTNEGGACNDLPCTGGQCTCQAGVCTPPPPGTCLADQMCCDEDFTAECNSGGSYWVRIVLASGDAKNLRCFVGAQGTPDCERDADGALVLYAAEDAVCAP